MAHTHHSRSYPERQSIHFMKHDSTNPPAETPAKGFSPGFAALGLEAALLTTLDTLGYEEPTPIQREANPPFLAGRDLLGQAAPGTGRACDPGGPGPRQTKARSRTPSKTPRR